MHERRRVHRNIRGEKKRKKKNPKFSCHFSLSAAGPSGPATGHRSYFFRRSSDPASYVERSHEIRLPESSFSAPPARFTSGPPRWPSGSVRFSLFEPCTVRSCTVSLRCTGERPSPSEPMPSPRSDEPPTDWCTYGEEILPSTHPEDENGGTVRTVAPPPKVDIFSSENKGSSRTRAARGRSREGCPNGRWPRDVDGVATIRWGGDGGRRGSVFSTFDNHNKSTPAVKDDGNREFSLEPRKWVACFVLPELPSRRY
jgi:hypothetical protein